MKPDSESTSGAASGDPGVPQSSDKRSHPNPKRRPINKRRLWMFRLIAALVLPTLILVVTEFGLRLAGAGYPSSFVIQSNDKAGVLQDNYKFAWRFFPKALARSSQPIVVSQAKPSDVMRIVVFGGSAAMGDPEAAYGLPRVLNVILDEKFPEQKFEVINAAVTAINSHVVYQIAKDCRRLNADAWVIYLGNNEVHGPFGAGTVFGGNETPHWLIRASLAVKQFKIGQLLASLPKRGSGLAAPKSWGGLEMFLNHQVRRDDPTLDRVYNAYRANLSDTFRIAVKQGTPVVVSTVATNLKDSAPFASLHDPALTDSQIAEWKSLIESGVAAQNSGSFEAALEHFQNAAKIDPQFADLQFRIGTCLTKLCRYDDATTAFEEARDADTLRFRADSKINSIISDVAENWKGDGVYLVDANQELAKQSPHGILGDEFLYEHVHFNFTGNFLLAKLIAEQLRVALELPHKNSWPTEHACAERLGLTAFHRKLVLEEVRIRVGTPPFNQQSNHENRLAKIERLIDEQAQAMTPSAAQDADASYVRLLHDYPQDWVLRKQYGAMLESMGRRDAAISQWEAITEQLPHYADGFYKLGVLQNQAKQWQAAKKALDKAVAIRPDYTNALNSLGICNSHLGKFEESYRCFQRAVERRPGFAEAYVNWGLVLLNQKDHVGAAMRFQSAIESDAKYLPAYVHLGKLYVDQKNFEAALPHYKEITRLTPDQAASHLNLGFLLIRLKKTDQAIASLERVLQLSPDNATAKAALAQLRSHSIAF